MKLRIGKRAQQQVDRIEAWWVEHRPEAPTLFIDELEAMFHYICGALLDRRPDRDRIRAGRLGRAEGPTSEALSEPCSTSARVVEVGGRSSRGGTPIQGGVMDSTPMTGPACCVIRPAAVDAAQ